MLSIPDPRLEAANLISFFLPVEGKGLANFSFPQDQALFVIGDVHGHAGPLRELLDAFDEIRTPRKNRSLVSLGDLGDRGPDSVGCLSAMLFEAQDRAYVDSVTILPGNHELMLADALCGDAGWASTWFRKGGKSLLKRRLLAADRPDACQTPPDLPRIVRDLAQDLLHPGHSSFVDMVRSWPSHFRLGDVLCVHVGVTPGVAQSLTLNQPQTGHLPDSVTRELSHLRHWAWVRQDFLTWSQGWRQDGNITDSSHFTGGSLIVHGHTIPGEYKPMTNAPDLATLALVASMGRRSDLRQFGRLCLDGGAARNVSVAGCLITCDGIQISMNVLPSAD